MAITSWAGLKELRLADDRDIRWHAQVFLQRRFRVGSFDSNRIFTKVSPDQEGSAYVDFVS